MLLFFFSHKFILFMIYLRRPDDSYLWFLSPLKTLKYEIWQNNKCLFVKIILVIILIVFILVVIYQAPAAFFQRLFRINT
jgi:hypothetical protein